MIQLFHNINGVTTAVDKPENGTWVNILPPFKQEEFTEVSEKLKGQGVAKKLLANMVEYVRANKLKVIALCPFVNAQFKRHPEQYADIWNQNWHKRS